jgi:nitroreductase
MDAILALKKRRSVRSYTTAPVAPAVLEDIVDCARLAATAINLQPWEFVAVTERGVLERLAAATDYGKFIASAAACIVVACRDTKYYLEDGSAATQNLLVAAHAYGLGSCWVAGDKKAYADDVLAVVGAPAGMKLISLVALGHPAEEPSKPKRELGKVLHWQHF